MDDQFKSIVQNSKSILILLPTKPFFDQVAGALALFLALREEKDVQVVSATPMIVDFNRIIGVNKITQEMGNKNLVIRFLGYKPDDIERIKYDLDNGQMFLTIIPKPQTKAPAKDQVQMSYAGVAADTIFLIGGTNDSHFPQLLDKDISQANLVHIGIKDIILSGKHPLSLSRPASSVSEVIYYLLKNTNTQIDQDVAGNLLMGIEEATENFADRSATADTFLAAAELMKHGAKRFSSLAPIMPSHFPPGAIPGVAPQMPFAPTQIPGGFTQNPQVPRHNPVSPAQFPQQQAPANSIEEDSLESSQNPPTEWLSKPKVYKGTSVS